MLTPAVGRVGMDDNSHRTVQLVALSAPSVAFAAFELSHRVLLPAFLTDHVGLGVGLVGAILLSVRLIDIFSDAVFGSLSDTDILPGFSRRKSWMALGMPIALIASLALFFAEPGWSATAIFILFTIAMTGWTMTNAAHGGWALEFASGIAARSRVFAARAIAAFVGAVSFTGLIAVLSPDSRSALLISAAFLFTTGPLALIVLLRFVPDTSGNRRHSAKENLFQVFLLCFETPRRRRLASLFALVGASSAIASGSFIYLVTYGLILPEWALAAFFIQSVAMAAGIVLGLRLQRRIGVKATLATVFTIDFILCASIVALPVGNPAWLVVWIVLRGLFSGIDFMLLRALAGEVLDQEFRETGRARAGAIYASFHMPLNLASALATGLLFWTYAQAGFDPATASGDLDGALAARVIPAVIGMAFAALSVLALLANKERLSSTVYTEQSL